MKSAILALIAERQHVDFSELGAEIPGFRGEMGLFAPGNVLLWSSLSQEALEALQDLLRSGLIHYCRTDVMNYLVRGEVERFPLVGRVPKAGYKTPRWLPVTLSTGDFESHRSGNVAR